MRYKYLDSLKILYYNYEQFINYILYFVLDANMGIKYLF